MSLTISEGEGSRVTPSSAQGVLQTGSVGPPNSENSISWWLSRGPPTGSLRHQGAWGQGTPQGTPCPHARYATWVRAPMIPVAFRPQ